MKREWREPKKKKKKNQLKIKKKSKQNLIDMKFDRQSFRGLL